MACSVLLTEDAAGDLSDIYTYIAEHDSLTFLSGAEDRNSQKTNDINNLLSKICIFFAHNH